MIGLHKNGVKKVNNHILQQRLINIGTEVQSQSKKTLFSYRGLSYLCPNLQRYWYAGWL